MCHLARKRESFWKSSSATARNTWNGLKAFKPKRIRATLHHRFKAGLCVYQRIASRHWIGLLAFKAAKSARHRPRTPTPAAQHALVPASAAPQVGSPTHAPPYAPLRPLAAPCRPPAMPPLWSNRRQRSPAIILRKRNVLIFHNVSCPSDCHYFEHKNPLPEGEETERPASRCGVDSSHSTIHQIGAGPSVFTLEREIIMNRSAVHWKVEYKAFSGALGAITVRAGTSTDAKRITAEITRTDPNDVLDACCVDVN
jgi:hypothetical protein